MSTPIRRRSAPINTHDAVHPGPISRAQQRPPQASLRRAVPDFMEHYHAERNHQGLGNRLIRGHPTAEDHNGIVQRRQGLGGMLNFYYRKAA